MALNFGDLRFEIWLGGWVRWVSWVNFIGFRFWRSLVWDMSCLGEDGFGFLAGFGVYSYRFLRDLRLKNYCLG